MADIGSLVVKLAAETSEFQADMGRAARTLESQVEGMRRSMLSFQNVAKTAFGVVIGVESVQALVSLAKSTIEAVSNLDDLAEKTGASVEALSALAPVAKLSGVGIDQVSEGLVKLSRGLAGADDETSKAGSALEFLGVTAKDSAGNLRDPAEVMFEVSQKLSEFRDGAGKTAIAVDLFGKSGANLLPFLKDLGENTDLVTRLTSEQAAEAENLDKALKRLTAQKEAFVKTLTVAAIPAIRVLVEEVGKAAMSSNGLLTATKDLQKDGTLAHWAEMAAVGVARVIDVFQVLGRVVWAIVGSFQAAWADLSVGGTVVGNFLDLVSGKQNLAQFTASVGKALDDRNKVVQEANERYATLWNAPLLSDAVQKRFDEIRKEAEKAQQQPPKPVLNYSTAKNRDNQLSVIEQRVKGLQALAEDEAANGGIMSGMGPLALNQYANGGIATGPQLALFGEGRMNEAYVPLPDGRTIPVTMSGGGGGDVFNISVSVSDAGASASGDEAGGRDLGKSIANAVRQELLAQKRAGGLLDARRSA